MKKPVGLRLNMTENSHVTGTWLVAAQFKTHWYNWYGVFFYDWCISSCMFWLVPPSAG